MCIRRIGHAWDVVHSSNGKPCHTMCMFSIDRQKLESPSAWSSELFVGPTPIELMVPLIVTSSGEIPSPATDV